MCKTKSLKQNHPMTRHLLLYRPNLPAILLGFVFCLRLLAADSVEDAVARLREGKTREGVDLLRKTLAENPSSLRAAYLLGQTLLDQEKFSESSEVVQKALALTPASADLLQTKGDIEFRNGDFPAAEMSYKKALQVDGKHGRHLWAGSSVPICIAKQDCGCAFSPCG
jgi:tetratricopeptide (TPR) repeat protein